MSPSLLSSRWSVGWPACTVASLRDHARRGAWSLLGSHSFSFCLTRWSFKPSSQPTDTYHSLQWNYFGHSPHIPMGGHLIIKKDEKGGRSQKKNAVWAASEASMLTADKVFLVFGILSLAWLKSNRRSHLSLGVACTQPLLHIWSFLPTVSLSIYSPTDSRIFQMKKQMDSSPQSFCAPLD